MKVLQSDKRVRICNVMDIWQKERVLGQFFGFMVFYLKVDFSQQCMGLLKFSNIQIYWFEEEE